MSWQNPSQEFVYLRTYARYLTEEQRRETWPETVDRVVSFLKLQRANVPAKVWIKLTKYMLNLDVLPSMRLVWAAGPAAARCNVPIYNCSFVEMKDIQSFSEMLYVLMCGTGVGFSVQACHVEQLPEVPKFPLQQEYIEHKVEDSKEGWADSLKLLLEQLFLGKSVNFDYSAIRPKGARLATMGGRASGPEPLVVLHQFVKDTLHAAQGRKLKPIEVHDICNKIAEIVVVGGVRRSSQISLSDLNDEDMRHAKDWPCPIHRFMANNSAVYLERPDAVQFMKEWHALAASGSGERGIFNLGSVRTNSPKRRNKELISGTNPCVPGDTEILTRQGYQRIDQLLGQEVEVWNGFEWSKVEPKITGENQAIVKVTLSNGRSLRCTPAHKWVIAEGYNGKTKRLRADELAVGMKLIKHEYPVIKEGRRFEQAYTQGFISADGMDDYDFLYLYETKFVCESRLVGQAVGSGYTSLNGTERKTFKLDFQPMSKDYVPFDCDLQSRLDWLAGLLDGDGTELKEGGVQVSSVNRSFLLEVQKLLTTCGVASKVTLGNPAGHRIMPDGRGGVKAYLCQEGYRLLIGATQMQELKELGLKCERLKLEASPNRDASRFVTIASIEEDGVEELVYCFTEPLRNLGCFDGIITGQCGEIALRDKQFCNLSTVIVRPEDTLTSLLDKVETAAWIGTIQASFTNFPYLRKEWSENCKEEALLGVSLSGQMDNVPLLTKQTLAELKRKCVEVNKHAAEVLGIKQAAAITCGKPEGTTSQLTFSGSGCHPWYSKYFIRRYRISASDPLCHLLKESGAPLVPEVGQTWETANTLVVEFPCKAPEGAILREQVSALDQLKWYKRVQTNWCEHNQSITVYVKPDEWFDVGNWVYKNWDIACGLSFLPYDGGNYQLAPYEEISQEEYQDRLARFPTIDYSQLWKYEQEDQTEGAKTYACVGDKCELS
jgi:ribonucleotide reductase alpha subunit